MARYKLANLLAEAGESDEAIRQAMVALRLNPVSSNTRLTLGNLYHQLGRLDDALQEFRAAAQLGQLAPQQALGYEKMGRVFQEMGEKAGAMAMFQTSLRLNPKAIFCYLHLARIHRGDGRLAEALEMSQAAVQLDPRFPEAVTLLAELRGLCGENPPALTHAPFGSARSTNGHARHLPANGVAHAFAPLSDLADGPAVECAVVGEAEADLGTYSCTTDSGLTCSVHPFCVTIAPRPSSHVNSTVERDCDFPANISLVAACEGGPEHAANLYRGQTSGQGNCPARPV